MADKTLISNNDTYVRFEKNEDGDKVKRRYGRGDKVVFTAAQAEKHLSQRVGGRPLWVEDEDAADNADKEVVRTDVPANDPRAAVKQGTLTSSVAPKSAK